MSDSSHAPTGAIAVQEWITGHRARFERVFFAEPGAAVAGVARRLTAHDALIAPVDAGPLRTPAVSVSFSGRLQDVGDELYLEEHRIELQDYATAAFVEILGPTVVRFGDDRGWQTFLQDADLARSTGILPAPLVDPRVQIADREALVEPFRPEHPTVIHVRADGRLTLGAQGVDLGSADELDAALAVSLPRWSAFGGIVPSERLTEDLGARPWLPRYLRAGDLARVLRIERGSDLFSGFGCLLVDDGLADAEPAADDPFLVVSPHDLVLADLASRRRRRLAPITAGVVEIVQTSSALGLAVRRVAAHAHTSEASARSLCLQALAELDVRLGSPASGSFIETAGRA